MASDASAADGDLIDKVLDYRSALSDWNLDWAHEARTSEHIEGNIVHLKINGNVVHLTINGDVTHLNVNGRVLHFRARPING